MATHHENKNMEQVIKCEVIKRMNNRNAERVVFSQDQKNFLDFLRNKFSPIYSMKDYLLSERKYGSIYGEMMSGKSQGMVAIHHYNNMFGVGSIQALQQSSDVKQFEQSIKEYNDIYTKYYRKKGWDVKHLQYEMTSSLKLDEFNNVLDPKNLASIFTHIGKPKTIIGIAHQDQFYRLIKIIYQKWGECPVKFRAPVAIYDESHLTMFPDETECVLDDAKLPEYVHGSEWPVKLSKYESINALIQFARQVHAVTATPQQNWFSVIHPPQFIIDITPSIGYRDILSVSFDTIPELPKGINFHDDPALHKVIAGWAGMKPMNKRDHHMKRNHPISSLVNVSRYTKDHQNIYDHIITNHPNEFVVITLNDNGTTMYLPPRIVEYMKNERDSIVETTYGVKEQCTNFHLISESNRVKYDKVPIAATYQFLSDLPEELVERIILISGDMVKQGRRISSFDYAFRLTDVFLRDPTSTGDNLQQKWRQVGYVFDNRPALRGYCTATVHENTVKGIKTIREGVDILKRELNDIHTARHLNTFKILKEMSFSSAKVGTKPMCKNKMPMELTSDDDDDFDLDAGDYALDIDRTTGKVLDVKMTRIKCKKKDCENKTRHATEKCRKCREKVTGDSATSWDKLRSCYKKNGKLHNIVNLFVSEGLRSLTSDELSVVCKGKFQYDNYNHWDLGRHAKYHIIDSVDKTNNWNLRHEVLDELSLDY
jgi:hypothetical protein